MDYREHRPSPGLIPWVRCIWEITADSTAERTSEPERVFPDGCMELIVHRGEPFSARDTDGKVIVQPPVLFHGQILRYLELLPPERVCTIGVRFHPAGAAAFFDLAFDGLTDRWLPLDALVGPSDLEARVREASSIARTIEAIEGFLTERGRGIDPTTDPVMRAADEIRGKRGQLPIGELAERLGLGQRQLERRFRRQVGLTPKQLATIERLQAAFRWIGQEPAALLTDAAHACGYYDQSHFIRDFRRLTGLSPTRFYRGHHEMAQLFVRDDSEA